MSSCLYGVVFAHFHRKQPVPSATGRGHRAPNAHAEPCRVGGPPPEKRTRAEMSRVLTTELYLWVLTPAQGDRSLNHLER